MKMKILLLPIMMIGLMATPLRSSAQDVEELLSKYTSENGSNYLQPFADAFSANLNSGLFHNARLKKMGFQIYLGLETQMAPIGSDKKTMTASTQGDFFPSTTVNDVPTVFGSTEGKKVTDSQSGLTYVFPGGLDLDWVPLATPQLTIGSVFGTDLTLRYFTTSQFDDVGDIDLFGWGIRHSIDQYLPLPINLTVGYYHQTFKIGDYMDAASNLISLQTSYSIPFLTIYGGLGYESGSMDIAYEFEDAAGKTQDIRFDLTPSNSMRMTLGLGLNLGPVKLHGDYNLASQSTFSVGMGIGIGE